MVLIVTGCASPDYARYIDTQAAIQTAKYNAEAEKYRAMANIAASGDTTTKVSAMMAMQNLGNNSQQQQIAAPKSGWEIAREMFSVLLPPVVQAYGINANQKIATTQSNNSRDVSLSTNSAFVNMASQIQAPQPNMTLSGTGVIGDGTYTTTSAPVTTTTTTDSHNTTTTTDNHASTTDSHNTTTDNHSVVDDHTSTTNNTFTCTTGPC